MNLKDKNAKHLFAVAGATISTGVIAASLAYGYAVYKKVGIERQVFEERTAVLEKTMEGAMARIRDQAHENRDLKDANTNLSQSLAAEQSKNQQFAAQIEELSGTVGKLQKLTATPPELLKKYSKVYFLNENYIPTLFTNVDKEYLFDQARPQQIYALVWPFLTGLLNAASSSGNGLRIVSAYRSFGEQASLKSNYTVLYGSGANQFSADQGYSEHQLGTTVDFVAPGASGLSIGFDATPSYQWLVNNAYKFGFVLSYPKGNTYYQYEPWHWRFVGKALATHIHDANLHFYDLLQSEIDTYLINIFD